MSQPPPWDQGQSSGRGEPPAWPSGESDQDQPPAWPPAKPDQGQPPSWPSGGPGQPPPPSWPPGGQPPYPGQGYSYGYGPRPPRFRRRHPLRGAIIALVLFIIFGFVVRNITASHSTVSVAPFPSISDSPATARQAPPGPIGSHFDLSDGSGNLYRVTLVKVVDPAKGADQFSLPESGKRFVGLIFMVKALAGTPKDEDANNDAVVIGGNGRRYSAAFEAIAGYTNFNDGAIHLAPGETVTGSVAFQVPNGVAAARVQWTALSGFGSTAEWNVRG